MADVRTIKSIHCGSCGREFPSEEEADACTHSGGQQRIGDTLREIADAEERAHGVSPYAPRANVQDAPTPLRGARSAKDQAAIDEVMQRNSPGKRSSWLKW